MEVKEELIGFLEIIDRKRNITEYTMNDLCVVAKKTMDIISEKDSDAKEILKLKKVLIDSNIYHKNNTHMEGSNIMSILRDTKFAIEDYLHREYNLEF